MSLENIILVLAGTVTGLSAGVYYTFNVGVVPALRDISPKAHIEFMRLLNVRIENPLFFLSFFGPAILLPLSAYLFRERDMFLLLVIAALLHIVGVISVTGVGNIPLNSKLADVDLNAISAEEADKIRREYQGPGTPWMRWHTVRTLAGTAATALIIIAALSG
jgi:uncharacterized membrane protein